MREHRDNESCEQTQRRESMTIIQGLDGRYIVDAGKIVKVINIKYGNGFTELELEDGRKFKVANVSIM
jgi:hypothetical protein